MPKKVKVPSDTPSPDTTERKRAEEALWESEEKYRSLVNNVKLGIFRSTPEPTGRFLEVNPAMEEITGYSREELLQMNVSDLYVHPEEREAILGQIASTIGKTTRELRFRKKDETEIVVSDTKVAVRDDTGKVLYFDGIVEDITERKQAEEALRESNKRFRDIAENALEWIWEVDTNGKYTYASPVVEKILGYKPEELLKEHFYDLFHPDDREELKKAAFEVFTKKQSFREFVNRNMHKNGKPVWLLTSGVPILDEEGNLLGYRGADIDITERKRMEKEIQDINEQLEMQNEELRATDEELRAANEELQATNEELRDAQEKLVCSEKLAAIGQLAGGVGHELKNPLGAIKNAVYYIRRKVSKSELSQKEPRVMEFLDIIDEEINSSSNIIDDLLGFSRVGKPVVSPTRIEKVIEDALSYTTIPENIELTKKLGTDLPEIKIDTDQVRQVLVNMILNAVQAMPAGGKLTISAGEKDKFLEVDIADTGCGIPQEVTDKIFDPLFTTRAKGIGLGLAVCKAIIDRHQGHIEVENKVGKRTTFTIKLPLEAE